MCQGKSSNGLNNLPFSHSNYNDAVTVLDLYANASFEEMKDKGDNLPFSYFFEDVNADELGLQLGSKFPEALIEKEMNTWIGPIPSGFGYHLVYITHIKEPQLPEFETIKKKVTDDYEYDHQNEMNELIYEELKKKYTIEIDIKSEDFDPKFVEYLQNEMNN